MSTEQGGSAPNLSNEGQGEKQPKKKGERGRRLRLVLYSSQESEDQDGQDQGRVPGNGRRYPNSAGL